MARRIIFLVLSALAGMALFTQNQVVPESSAVAGLVIGAVIGGLILLGELGLAHLSFGVIAAAAGGLAAGLVLAGLGEWAWGGLVRAESLVV